VLRRERAAVHRVGEQHLVAQGLLDWQAPLVVVLDPPIDAPVVAGEDDLDGVVQHARLLEDGSQGRAGPLGAPDRLLVPRRRDRTPGEAGAPVAAALHRHGHGDGRARPYLVEG
jgi:hypothetical protein